MSVKLRVERWGIISMMVFRNVTVTAEHNRSRSELSNALVVIEYGNNIIENSPLNNEHNP